MNWAAVKPDWIDDHGTVIVLLGNSGADDTVLGDPNRAEADIKGISSYLNRRLWELPEQMVVFVDELRTQDKRLWPASIDQEHGPSAAGEIDRRTNMRRVRGACFYVEYARENFTAGRLDSSGTVRLSDGTEVDWFLWAGERPAVQSYAAIGGCIATLYKGELYDVATYQATYRPFAINEASVRNRASGSSSARRCWARTVTTASIREQTATRCSSRAGRTRASLYRSIRGASTSRSACQTRSGRRSGRRG